MHGEIFEKINKKSRSTKETENSAEQDSRVLESIKILGKQVIEIREIIDEQDKTIKALRKEIEVLRNRQNETEGNVRLAHIDQKDMSKQIRILRANVSGNQIVEQRSAANANVTPTSMAQIQASFKTPDDISEEYFPNYQTSQIMKNSKALEMIDQAMKPAAIEQEPSREEMTTRRAEEIAKQFIFGRMPKLLKLD